MTRWEFATVALLILAMLGAATLAVFNDRQFDTPPVATQTTDPQPYLRPKDCTVTPLAGGGFICPVNCGCGPPLEQVVTFVTPTLICDSNYSTDADGHRHKVSLSCKPIIFEERK